MNAIDAYLSLVSRVQQEFDDVGGPTRLRILLWVERADHRPTQAEIASRTRTAEYNVCRLLPHLIRSHLIRIDTDANNAKLNRVALTARGRQCLAGLEELIHDALMDYKGTDRVRKVVSRRKDRAQQGQQGLFDNDPEP